MPDPAMIYTAGSPIEFTAAGDDPYPAKFANWLVQRGMTEAGFRAMAPDLRQNVIDTWNETAVTAQPADDHHLRGSDMHDDDSNSTHDDTHFPPAFISFINARGVALADFQKWDFDLRDSVISAWNSHQLEQAEAVEVGDE
jgi:hypothetical protein